MTQTRITNRIETEHNLTIGSALEGKFANRKEFGAWLDKLNSKVRAPRKKRK
jgi:hypothetical protein